LLYCGTGTQKVEDELGGIFPDARIVRMDLDTTAGIDSHFKILEAFQRGKYDILLGTQMVAKGLDFPEVTLVGIISADTELLLPDFRSEERTFRLLVQAAGRSGRHKPGEVVVQTYNPEHPVFKFVQDNDYAGFFDKTVRLRQHLQYPPFGRLIAVRISSPREASAGESAIEFARKLEQAGVNLLGPAPALLSKIKRRYYYNILIKLPLQHTIKDLAGLKERLLSLKADLMKERKSEDVHIEIDVDPVALH
jgi:primosomal protein N' (replication factor Y)